MTTLALPGFDWRTILHRIAERRRALMQSYGVGQAVVDGSSQGAAEVYGAKAVGGAAAWWLSGGIAAANCLAAYQPKGAASLAASYTNLANPGTYTAAPGVAPTWDATNGWIGSGAQWLTTGVVPASGYSMICRFSNCSGTIDVICGSYSGGSTYSFLQPRFTDNKRYYGNGGFLGVSGILAAGTMATAGSACYKDGLADGTISAAWSGASTRAIYALGFNNGGTAQNIITGYIQALAIYNTEITAAQVLAVHTAMAAL